MPQIPVNLIKGDKVGEETDYRDALPVNMYAVMRPILGAAGYMIQEPGLEAFATGSGADRGAMWNENQQSVFRVSGERLMIVGELGAVQDLGGIPGTLQAAMPYSFNTQAVVVEGRYYLYDPTNGFREVTDPDLGDPIDCTWIDGYYFFTDGENIYHTDITDETAIDPLKFATAEFMPDPTLGVAKTLDNKVMVFDRYSCEFFINRASTNFAFTRVPNRALGVGIVGTHAKTEVAGSWFVVGGGKEEATSVYRLGVGSAEKIATREVEKIIGLYTEEDLFRIRVESYEEDGVSFVIIHLSEHTLKLNVTLARSGMLTHAWSILKSDVVGNDTWRAINGIFDPRIPSWQYGDKLGSTIGLLKNDVATHYDELAEWLLFTPFIYLDGGSIDKLDIETVPGFTTTEDATVFLSLSHDGVHYGKEWTVKYGNPNEYGKNFIARRLGYVNEWAGIKMRGATRSRMCFSRAVIDYG
jgi:hypothetical protein